MGTYEELLQNYAVNEHILKSKSADCDAKNSAWRQQAVILHHLTRYTCAATQHEALQQHAKKLSYEDEASILQKRAAAVDALLGGFSSPIEDPTTSYPQLSELDDVGSLLESGCRGSYQSCRHVEMTEAVLQQFRGANGGNDSDLSSKAGDAAFAQHHSSINSVKCGKNTLSAYLQPKALPPTTKIDAADVPGISNREEYENWQEQQLPQPKVINKQNEYSSIGFRTAREELFLRNMKKNGDPNGCNGNNFVPDMPLLNYGLRKKTLGARRIANSNIVPFRTEAVRSTITSVAPPTTTHQPSTQSTDNSRSIPQQADERLKNIDPKMIEMITNEIIYKNEPVDWDDIAGLDYAKSILKEAVVYPLLRPDIFTGLRRPPRGILLFGPPGTGKTLIGKCIASKSQSTFFSISASSLTSKWMGDGEKMVRALFAVAVAYQPSVVFIDEIDSLLSQRSELDHESSRRLKTEFLVQLDGASTSKDDRVLIVGATNRPQELDEAARRRLVRRLYIPLPELEARIQILTNLLQTVSNSLTNETVREIGNLTAGYSCADMESLCGEASMEPIRTIPADQIPYFKKENVRPMNMHDFVVALQRVRPSVSENALEQYTEWNRIYGAGN